MPTYDYECTHCGYKFELSQEMIAEPIKKCPKCNIDLQSYYKKPDGDHIINYKRCKECLEIYEEIT